MSNSMVLSLIYVYLISRLSVGTVVYSHRYLRNLDLTCFCLLLRIVGASVLLL